VTRIFTSDTDAPGRRRRWRGSGSGREGGGAGLMQRVCPHTRERAAVVPSAIGADPRGGNELHLLAELAKTMTTTATAMRPLRVYNGSVFMSPRSYVRASAYRRVVRAAHAHARLYSFNPAGDSRERG